MSPRVSVVVPAYGHAQWIGEALESVFAQTYADVEVVVVNDGSPDATGEVLRPLAEAGRIVYVEQPNAGQGAARNRGLALARGEYVAYLDDDDRWPPDKLAWQVEALDADPGAVLVYGEYATLGADGVLAPHDPPGRPSGDVLHDFRLRNWIDSPGQTLIRARALRAVGGFDPAIWGADDWDLYIRLARTGRFRYVPRVALHYRVHDGNASRSAMRHARNHFKVVRRHLGWNLPLLARHLPLAARYFVPNLMRSADALHRDGRRGDALRAYLFALLFRPALLTRPWYLRPLARTLLPAPPARGGRRAQGLTPGRR